jgi:hypothetical protein
VRIRLLGRRREKRGHLSYENAPAQHYEVAQFLAQSNVVSVMQSLGADLHKQCWASRGIG